MTVTIGIIGRKTLSLSNLLTLFTGKKRAVCASGYNKPNRINLREAERVSHPRVSSFLSPGLSHRASLPPYTPWSVCTPCTPEGGYTQSGRVGRHTGWWVSLLGVVGRHIQVSLLCTPWVYTCYTPYAHPWVYTFYILGIPPLVHRLRRVTTVPLRVKNTVCAELLLFSLG